MPGCYRTDFSPSGGFIVQFCFLRVPPCRTLNVAFASANWTALAFVSSRGSGGSSSLLAPSPQSGDGLAQPRGPGGTPISSINVASASFDAGAGAFTITFAGQIAIGSGETVTLIGRVFRRAASNDPDEMLQNGTILADGAATLDSGGLTTAGFLDPADFNPDGTFSKTIAVAYSDDPVDLAAYVFGSSTALPAGACFLPDGACEELTADDCAAAGGTYFGDGSACPALPPVGACCFPDDSCFDDLTSSECFAVGGRFRGPLTTCNDGNFNGVADVCECVTCPGDTNRDFFVNGRDVQSFIDCLLNPPPAPVASRGATGADDCADAEPLAGEGVFPFDNSSATTDGPEHVACESFGETQIERDVWFCWTAPCTDLVDFRTCGLTDVDTRLAIYDGCACPPTDANLLACNDDGDNCGFQSAVRVPVEMGRTYLIRIGSFPGTPGGPGEISISCVSGGPPPSADECTAREVIGGEGVFPFNNADATQDGPPTPICQAFGTTQIDHDVWFCWKAPADGRARIDTCAQTAVDTRIAVYAGCACPPELAVACNDDACGLQSAVEFDAAAGQVYLVRLGTYPGAPGGTGTFTIGYTVPGVPSSDCLCADMNGDAAIDMLDVELFVDKLINDPRPACP